MSAQTGKQNPYLQKPNSHQHGQHPKGAARKIDPVIVQPLPATNVDCLCATGMKWMFLGLFFVGRTEVHRLHGRAEERVKE